MRRTSLLIALVVLSSASASGDPRVVAQNIMLPSSVSLVFAASDSSDSDPIPTNGNCYARYQQAGGDDVSLYAVVTQTAATSSGSLLVSFTASTSPSNPPFQFKPDTLFVKAKADDSTTGGSVLTIDCEMDSGLGSGSFSSPAAVSASDGSGGSSSTFPSTFPFTMG